MRVLHIQKATGIGGSERHLLVLLPALADRGVETHMCVLAAGDSERFVDPMRAAGVPTTVVAAGPRVNPVQVPRLWRVIRKLRPDIVHTHLLHGDLYGQLAARAAGVTGVSTIHMTPPFYGRQPYRSAQQLAGRLAARTICVSDYARGVVTRLGLARPAAIRVIPYGVDVAQWLLTDEERTAARYELGLAPDDVAFGVASRLAPYKGHDFLLDAFSVALESGVNARLLVAGDGPLKEHIESRIRAFSGGAVTMLGYVQDARRFINACDAIVFPTVPGFGEGLPVVVVEAMAAARPLIATKVYSVAEAVVEDESGILVGPKAVDELSRAITLLARDAGLRDRMGANGRKRAVERFSLETTVYKTLAVYRELV